MTNHEVEFYGEKCYFTCDPPEKATTVLNYLITGYPLADIPLDGIKVTFFDDENNVIWKGELLETHYD